MIERPIRGGLWEGQAELALNHEFQTDNVEPPCPHCVNYRAVEQQGYANPDHHWTDHYWTCPRVIIAWNEGGHATTGVCIDCVIDEAAQIRG